MADDYAVIMRIILAGQRRFCDGAHESVGQRNYEECKCGRGQNSGGEIRKAIIEADLVDSSGKT
jgi:hypothetical protein